MSLPRAKADPARATIVVPTYNESDNIGLLLARIHAVAPGAEVLIVDDGSPDGTAEAARALVHTYPVRVIERKGERGLSTAVLRGFQEATTDICVVMDADLSHPPEALPALLEAVASGADVAVGSRYVPGGDIDEWPFWRRLYSKAGTLLARPLTPVADPMAGYFCTRRSLLAGTTLRPRGFKILLEILARTKARRVVEVPIRFGDRAAGRSKFGSAERREFLRQVWTLYRELDAWPYRVARILLAGGLGYLLLIAVLSTLAALRRHGLP